MASLHNAQLSSSHRYESLASSEASDRRVVKVGRSRRHRTLSGSCTDTTALSCCSSYEQRKQRAWQALYLNLLVYVSVMAGIAILIASCHRHQTPVQNSQHLLSRRDLPNGYECEIQLKQKTVFNLSVSLGWLAIDQLYAYVWTSPHEEIISILQRY